MKKLNVKRVLITLLIAGPLLFGGFYWYLIETRQTGKETISKEDILSTEDWNISRTPKKDASTKNNRPRTDTKDGTDRSASGDQNRTASGDLPPAGPEAPSLEVSEWVNGDPVTLEDLRGKVVVLEFIQII